MPNKISPIGRDSIQARTRITPDFHAGCNRSNMNQSQDGDTPPSQDEQEEVVLQGRRDVIVQLDCQSEHEKVDIFDKETGELLRSYEPDEWLELIQKRSLTKGYFIKIDI